MLIKIVLLRNCLFFLPVKLLRFIGSLFWFAVNYVAFCAYPLSHPPDLKTWVKKLETMGSAVDIQTVIIF